MTQILDRNGNPFAPSATAQSTMTGPLQQRNRPIDAFLLSRKVAADAAATEASFEHGFAQAGVQLHIDNIVGNLFKLNYQPLYDRLGMPQNDALAFGRDVEAWWEEISDDPRAFIDAEEKRTFTQMMRECAGIHCRQGEWMAQPLWLPRRGTSLRTAIKLVNPNRVSNPHGAMETSILRGGIKLSAVAGAPISYFVQQPAFNNMAQKWIEIPKYTRHGRPQFLHIFEPSGDGNTRAPTQFMSIIKRLGKLDKFQDTALENAIVNAMFATVIESELDAEQAFQLISEDKAGQEKIGAWMDALGTYHENQNGLIMGSGVRAAHMMPGETLGIKRAGVDGVGIAEYERSILRYIAAGLNVSYEQLARDYSQVSYSSARASLMETWRYMMGRRKMIVGRAASEIFALCFEDALDAGELTLPRSAKRGFYEARHAWTNSDWIGTGRLAIDEVKEVKAAALRISTGISTLEDECAILGKDYRKVLAQRAREISESQDLNIAAYPEKMPLAAPQKGNAA